MDEQMRDYQAIRARLRGTKPAAIGRIRRRAVAGPGGVVTGVATPVYPAAMLKAGLHVGFLLLKYGVPLCIFLALVSVPALLYYVAPPAPPAVVDRPTSPALTFEQQVCHALIGLGGLVVMVSGIGAVVAMTDTTYGVLASGALTLFVQGGFLGGAATLLGALGLMAFESLGHP